MVINKISSLVPEQTTTIPSYVNMDKVASIVLCGGEGKRLFPLTQKRCKPALIFGGRYRLVDVPISSSINSGIRKIFLLTQYLSAPLHQHIMSTYRFDSFSLGSIHLLSAEQNSKSNEWFEGTADAIRKMVDYIKDVPVEYFLILSGDQLYNIQFQRMVQMAKSYNADAVVASTPVDIQNAQRMGIMKICGTGKILDFVEKPNKVLAQRMFDEGDYFWNSGIFMFRASDIISALELYAKEIKSIVMKSVNLSEEDLAFTKLDPKNWSKLEAISIDYAIMEKAKNLVAIPFHSGWSDLGNWDSVWREEKHDQYGVALSKNAHAIECKNSLLRSENNNQEIVGLGLEDIVAISMPDAVLVANKNKSQDVKKVVEYLKSKKISQSEIFIKDHRPWGSFEILSEGVNFKVKKIIVKSGAALSLQSHKHRSEHWVIVEGSAVVTIDENKKVLSAGQSTYVPLGSIHRLENYEQEPLIIIEIQIGTYLGEDDIIRYEDDFGRS